MSAMVGSWANLSKMKNMQYYPVERGQLTIAAVVVKKSAS